MASTASEPGSLPSFLLHVMKVSPSMASARTIGRQELWRALKANDPNINVINVCERSEPFATNPPVPGSIVTPLGELLLLALKNEEWKKEHAGKKLVIYCAAGMRSAMAVVELMALGWDAYSLEGGAMGWVNPAASSYDFCVVFGQSPSTSQDKLSSGLTAALASLRSGTSTAVVLAGDGVLVGCNKVSAAGEETASLAKAFLEEGGTFFACGRDLAPRKMEWSDMQPWVSKAALADVARWLAKGGAMQFL